jgi:hypothetical protein
MRGSVRQKGAGRWQVPVSLGRDPVSGRYRTIAREVRGRKRDAELLAAKLVAEVEHGTYRDHEVSRHSVADLSTLSIRKNHAVLSASFNQAPRWGTVSCSRAGTSPWPSDRDGGVEDVHRGHPKAGDQPLGKAIQPGDLPHGPCQQRPQQRAGEHCHDARGAKSPF